MQTVGSRIICTWGMCVLCGFDLSSTLRLESLVLLGLSPLFGLKAAGGVISEKRSCASCLLKAEFLVFCCT